MPKQYLRDLRILIKVEEIELKTGKVIKTRKLNFNSWEEKDKLIFNETNNSPTEAVLYRPINILSANKKYLFKGSPTYGNFELKNSNGLLIRNFQFSSGIE